MRLLGWEVWAGGLWVIWVGASALVLSDLILELYGWVRGIGHVGVQLTVEALDLPP